ncbi:unnamed protein product [Prunus armeniaca]
MKKNKFTEQYLSGIPYLMTLLLSAAWYGLPLVSPKNIFGVDHQHYRSSN